MDDSLLEIHSFFIYVLVHDSLGVFSAFQAWRLFRQNVYDEPLCCRSHLPIYPFTHLPIYLCILFVVVYFNMNFVYYFRFYFWKSFVIYRKLCNNSIEMLSWRLVSFICYSHSWFIFLSILYIIHTMFNYVTIHCRYDVEVHSVISYFLFMWSATFLSTFWYRLNSSLSAYLCIWSYFINILVNFNLFPLWFNIFKAPSKQPF